MQDSNDKSMIRGEETDVVSAYEKAIAAREEIEEIDEAIKSLRYQKLYESRQDDEQKAELESRLRRRRFDLQGLLRTYNRFPEFVRRIAEKRWGVVRQRSEWQRLKAKLLGKAQERRRTPCRLELQMFGKQKMGLINHTRIEVEQAIATGDGAEGIVQFAPAVIHQLGVPWGHRLCCVRMSDSREQFKAGDIGLIDIDAEVVHGARALVTNGVSWAIMRVLKTEDGYTFAPLGRSPLQPWFVDNLDGFVVGKLVKVFSRGDAKVFKQESE